MKLRWTPEAIQDRADVMAYIAEDSPQAAIRMDQLFSEAAARLVKFPHSGRPGIVPGARELLPHRSYRLIYEVAGDTVWVLALIHAARRWPSLQP